MTFEIGDLVTGTLRELTKHRLLQLATTIENQKRLYELLTTPEQRAASQKAYESEMALREAIERAKSPAQKLREKQAVCRHEFKMVGKRYRCTRCKLRPSTMFVTGYRQGYSHGDEDGREAASD